VDAMTMQYGYKLPDCSWDRVKPFWMVSEIQGELLGAIQICIGWPLGRIELLAIRPGLSRTKTAKVAKALIYYALRQMAIDGTTLACTQIPAADEEFARILERSGAKHMVSGKISSYNLTPHQPSGG
jgi:hypothetical protein